MYDAFNENRGFNQRASNNGISQSTTQSIGRYGLVSFAYLVQRQKPEKSRNGRRTGFR